MKGPTSKISTQLLRAIPLICVLFYVGVLNNLDSLDETLRFSFLIGMIILSLIVLVILALRKEIWNYNFYILAFFIIGSLIIYFFSR